MDEKRQFVKMTLPDDITLHPTPDADPKQKHILEAAGEAFIAFGYRRTSMEEIARRAGMSRAALYLHYKNKEDIYASLVSRFYDEAAEGFSAGLAAGTTPTDALVRGFKAKLSPAFRAISASPHASELLDISSKVGGQVVAQGETIMRLVLADWLGAEVKAQRISLTRTGGSAVDTAQLILSAAHGVKAAVSSVDEAETRLLQLATAFGHALTP